MLYILGLLTALQVVAAQTLWKIGLERVGFTPSKDFLLSSQMFSVFTSPLVVLGVLLYVSATICFFAVLSKFDYSQAQTVVVTSSICFTFISAVAIFGENLKPINFLGIACLLLGVFFITRF